MSIELDVKVEKWPLANTFRISREVKIEAEVVVVTLNDGKLIARGECVFHILDMENL